MTVQKDVANLLAISHTVRGERLLMIIDAGVQSTDQRDLAYWCLAAPEFHVLGWWGRATAILRLPDDVRELAQLN